MTKDIFRFFLLFAVLIICQVLICNHIALFNVAVPIIFIYFILHLPINLGKGWLFTLAFFTGLIVDICADTPGVNALASTLLAGAKRPIYYAYVTNDDRTKNLIPSISTLGVATFCKFLVTMVGIYCLLVFSIEYFNFANVKDIVLLSSASCVFTFILLLAIDCLIIK